MAHDLTGSPESTEHERWMEVAIAHAGSGPPAPGPHVAAIVVKNGVLAGAARHSGGRAEHAVVAVLQLAGEAARGATLYVTLEPHDHDARAKRCIPALLEAGPRRIVIGCREPRAAIGDAGLEGLRAAGIDVIHGVREAEARALIAPWTKFVTTGLPYVSLKLALSMDGRVATRTGASKWITSPAARAKGHVLRARNHGCAVGIGTALADDPHLTVRDAPGESPVRIVFDTQLRLPTSAHLVRTARDVPTMVLCGSSAPRAAEEALARSSVECLRVPLSAEGRLDVHAALRLLAQRGIATLMVEGGAALAGSLLANALADELHVFLAPILLGPRGRAGAVDWGGPETPSTAPRIGAPSWEIVGPDAYVHGAVVYPVSCASREAALR